MQLFQLIGIAFITAIAAILLKETKPELAFAVVIAGSIILLLFVFDILKEGMGIFAQISEIAGIDISLVKILLKMVGIGYIVEFSAGILTDFGQNSLADKLIFSGKIIILILAIPIIESVLELIVGLLGLIK